MCASRLQYEIGHVKLCIQEGDLAYKREMIKGMQRAVTKAREYLAAPERILQDYGV